MQHGLMVFLFFCFISLFFCFNIKYFVWIAREITTIMKKGKNIDNYRGNNMSENLFQKVLSRNDLNDHIVILKREAQTHFPSLELVENVKLTFFEKSMRSWNFTYSLSKSKSSESKDNPRRFHHLTREWKKFVEEKKLKRGDTVTFSKVEFVNKDGLTQRNLMIDVKFSENKIDLTEKEVVATTRKRKYEVGIESLTKKVHVEENKEKYDQAGRNEKQQHGIKLFGVLIFPPA